MSKSRMDIIFSMHKTQASIEKQIMIEKKIGDFKQAAHMMYLYGTSNKKWAENL